jgi:hypothetical protein
MTILRNLLLLSGASAPTLTLTATTAGPGNVTIHRMTPAAGTSLTIDWGDGGTTTVAAGDVAAKIHAYAAAGTWNIRVTNPRDIVQIDLHDAQLSGLKSAELRQAAITYFICYSIGNAEPGRFDSVDVGAWRPTIFWLSTLPAGYAGTFNSVDVGAWRPTIFYMYTLPAGYAGTFNSVDVGAWRPTIFWMLEIPAGYAGTFNSVDVSAWRPTTFRMYALPAGYAGTFNSVDVGAWRPTTFDMHTMPVGYTLIAGGGFANWTTTTNFQVQGNGLNQATVNAILWELYQASVTPRTGVGGTINVAGTNAAPSGVYQACGACPVNAATDGKEICHEFGNDGCMAGFPVWAVVQFTA